MTFADKRFVLKSLVAATALAGLCGCGLVAMAVAPRYKGKRVA